MLPAKTTTVEPTTNIYVRPPKTTTPALTTTTTKTMTTAEGYICRVGQRCPDGTCKYKWQSCGTYISLIT